jgi:hypothetical protein
MAGCNRQAQATSQVIHVWEQRRAAQASVDEVRVISRISRVDRLLRRFRRFDRPLPPRIQFPLRER